MAQSQQAEEVLSLQVSLFHRLHQTVVMKVELWVSQSVPGEVHFLCLLQRKRSSGEEQKELEDYVTNSSEEHAIVYTYSHSHLCYFHPISRKVEQLTWITEKHTPGSIIQPTLLCNLTL